MGTTIDAINHAERRKARRKLVREAGILFGLAAVAIVAVYYFYGRSTSGSAWKVGGTDVQDISESEGIQTEVSVATDPSDPSVLFAAANESLEPRIRVFSSTDGGVNWDSSAGPIFNLDNCAWGDPSVAIGPNGRQYVAYIE